MRALPNEQTSPAPQPEKPQREYEKRVRPQKRSENPAYDQLMDMVEALRAQFPNASDEQILEWAKKRIELDRKQNDMWAGVAAQHKATKMRVPPSRLGPVGSEVNKFAKGLPPKQQQPPSAPVSASPSAAPPGAQAPDNPSAYIPSGATGVLVPNPEFGKKHGLVWAGNRWEDGSAQSQAMEAQKAEQAFLAEKRQMELEQLRMQMELDRLQKEREMRGLRQDPALAGLAGGEARMQPVRPLAGRGLLY